MDAVTRSLVKEFGGQHGFDTSNEHTLFEHFANYLIVSDQVGADFDFESIATGDTEFGIDGIAIVVNDTLIEDEDQLDDVVSGNKVLEVSFLFVQSKTSSGFSAGEILKFTTAVQNFFHSEASLNSANAKIQEAHTQYKKIYENASKFSRGLPNVHMYYVSTGTWKSDIILNGIINAVESSLMDTSLFASARVTAVDASRIQSLYFKTKNAIKAEVDIPISVPMPEIVNIREAYIGVIRVSEFLKLILDEKGDIIKKIFFDNLRDFQGETEVNKSILSTLSSSNSSQFPLRNNGITVVARNLTRVGNKYIVEDYQIVNGCQTSHVIAKAKDTTPNSSFCPIKIINTDHEESIKEIIISSNRQNEISSDSFWILDDIHKKIEVYFEHRTSPLYYERRSGQFSMQQTIEKTRIISKDVLLKAFASMFLAETNRVGRYYKDLLPQIRKTIFAANHNLAPYYTAALSHWRLEYLFRAKRIDRQWKAFRYPLLLIARYLVEAQEGLQRDKSFTDAYCEAIDEHMMDADKAERLYREANDVANSIVKEMNEQYTKRVSKMRDFKERIEAHFSP